MIKKEIFLIGLFTLFSLTASEKQGEKRKADQAELSDNQLPPKKRINREGTVIIDQQKTPKDSAIALPIDLPLVAAQAAQHVTSQELPLPDAPYHCPQCKGKFEISKEEHEKGCIPLNANICCVNQGCRRTFKGPGHLKAHLRHCPHRK